LSQPETTATNSSSSWKVPAEVGIFLAIVATVANFIPEIAPLIGDSPEMALIFVAILFLVTFMASKDRIQGWFNNLGNNQIDHMDKWGTYFDSRLDEMSKSLSSQSTSIIDLNEMLVQTGTEYRDIKTRLQNIEQALAEHRGAME